MSRWLLAAVTTTMLLAPEAGAMESVEKGRVVTLKLPTALLSKGRSGLLEQRPTYIVDIVQEGDRIHPWNAPGWRTAGFPDLGEFVVDDIRRKKDYTEVELAADERVVKLRFLDSVRDLPNALSMVTALGRPGEPAAQAYLESTFSFLAEELIEGRAANLPGDVQLELVRVIHDLGGHGWIDDEAYRGKNYLVVRLGHVEPRSRLFVTNPLARAAVLMNEQLFSTAKRFWRPLDALQSFDGLKIEADLPRRGTAERKSQETDRLEWYAPRDALSDFLADQVTSADLLEASIVLLEANRVELPLGVGR